MITIVRALLLLFALLSMRVEANKRWSLSDKNIVVTGGSKGIGLAIVRECCALGATVLTCARNIDDLNLCLEKLRAEGYESVEGVIADVSTEEGRGILVKECKRKFSKVDCLINNVGSNIRKPMVTFRFGSRWKCWRRIFLRF